METPLREGQVVRVCTALSPGLMTQDLVILRVEGPKHYVQTHDGSETWIEVLTADEYRADQERRAAIPRAHTVT